MRSADRRFCERPTGLGGRPANAGRTIAIDNPKRSILVPVKEKNEILAEPV